MGDITKTGLDMVKNPRTGFEALIADYAPDLIQYISWFVDGPRAARRVVEKTFLKLASSWRCNNCPTDNLRLWLYRVAYQTAVRRGHGRFYSIPPGSPQSALAGLTSAQRQVVVLRVQGRFSLEQISLITGHAEKEVEHVLNVSLRKIAVELAKSGGQRLYPDGCDCSALLEGIENSVETRHALNTLCYTLAESSRAPDGVSKKVRRKIRRIIKLKTRSPRKGYFFFTLRVVLLVAVLLFILSGLLLPNLGRVRTRARRINDLTSLNAVWKGLSSWGLSPDYADRPTFPDRLNADLMEEVGMSPDLLKSHETGRPIEYYPCATDMEGDRPILVSHGKGGRHIMTASGRGMWVPDGTPEAEELTRTLENLPKQVADEEPAFSDPGREIVFSISAESADEKDSGLFGYQDSSAEGEITKVRSAHVRNFQQVNHVSSKSQTRKESDESFLFDRVDDMVSGGLPADRAVNCRVPETTVKPAEKEHDTRDETRQGDALPGELVTGGGVAGERLSGMPVGQTERARGMRSLRDEEHDARLKARVAEETVLERQHGFAFLEEDKETEVLNSPAPSRPVAGEKSDSLRASEPARKPAEERKLKEEVNNILELDQIEEEAVEAPVVRAFGVNPFVSAAEKPFSTFSIDVDTASYTFARNYLMRGLLPPPESVRTEEFVNYFDYGYQPPEAGTFAVYTECGQSAFGRGKVLLKIGVKGRRLGREEKRRAILTVLIDTSGSMAVPDRLGLAKQALTGMVKNLDPNDLVAVVQFDGRARLALAHTPASEQDTILGVIENLQTSGSTALSEGIKLAYTVASGKYSAAAFNQVVLLSDGIANFGTADADEILNSVERYRKQGITLSVFGFGFGSYDDAMLETLANKGDGFYSFVDSPEEAERALVDNFSATVNVIARDVKIQVEFNPERVRQYRQLGYENRMLKKEDFRDDSVDAGEIGSGQAVTALYELELVNTGDAPIGTVRVRCRNALTGQMEEIEQKITHPDDVRPFEEMSPHFRLAAAVAHFAEILRGSPFAAGSRFDDVARTLRPVAAELNMDRRVRELLHMTQTGLTPKF